MTITIPTRNIGEVQDIYRNFIEFKYQLEDRIERWIKSNLRLNR